MQKIEKKKQGADNCMITPQLNQSYTNRHLNCFKFNKYVVMSIIVPIWVHVKLHF